MPRRVNIISLSRMNLKILSVHILRHYSDRVIIYANNGARRSRRCPHRSSWRPLKTSGEVTSRVPVLQSAAICVRLERTSCNRASCTPLGEAYYGRWCTARDFLPNSTAFRRRSRSLATVVSSARGCAGWRILLCYSHPRGAVGSATASGTYRFNGKYANRSRARANKRRMSRDQIIR